MPVAVVEYEPNDRTYVAKRIATGEVIAITPDRHEARKAAQEDHSARVAEARKSGLKPTRTASGLPIVHIRMARRRNELIRLAQHRRKYGIDLGDLGNWAWVTADALVFGRHGADYVTFMELAKKMDVEFSEALAMRAIRSVNGKIKIKRKNYRPFAGRAVARMLDVTAEERWLCKIQTIAAVDETEAEARRREDRRACDRERDRRRRAAAEGERDGNYRHGLHTKETQTRLRAMRDLRREVKELTRKLQGGMRSGKFKPEGMP